MTASVEPQLAVSSTDRSPLLDESQLDRPITKKSEPACCSDLNFVVE